MKEISLIYLFNLALRRIGVLILSAIVFAAGAYGYCKYLAVPQYTAKASVLVTNGSIMEQRVGTGKDTISTTDIAASINLVDTVTDILQTSGIYKQLADQLGDGYSYDQLKGRMSISKKTNNSMFVDVSFTASDPNEARKIVNAFVELTPEYIVEFVPYSNVAVAATADSAGLIYPRTLVTTFFMAIIGAVLSFAVVFLIDSLDQAIKGESDFTSNYNIPLIGSVPDFETIGIVSTNNYYQKGTGNNGY